jgi:hypothetical protein
MPANSPRSRSTALRGTLIHGFSHHLQETAMLERRHQPLLPRTLFLLRVLRNFLVSAGIVLGSLLIGAAGYHHFVKLPWVDALLNASMILTGMGPVDPVTTTAGKLFATAYALFSGVVFLTAVAVLFAPVLHRFVHRFHLDFEDQPSRLPPVT